LALLRRQSISLTHLLTGILSAIVNRPWVTVLPLPLPPFHETFSSHFSSSRPRWRSTECTFIADLTRLKFDYFPYDVPLYNRPSLNLHDREEMSIHAEKQNKQKNLFSSIVSTCDNYFFNKNIKNTSMTKNKNIAK